MRRVTAILIRCEVSEIDHEGKTVGRGLTADVPVFEAAFTPELIDALRACGVDIHSAQNAR